jgi:dihydrofolate synthase/folylpolyglutamate synthase
MTRTLDEWLAYQERVNVRSIELGLDRVRAVWQAMDAPSPARRVITVGGTNGKGSTVALLESMLTAAGQRVGCYTSPHLLHYRERIRIGGMDASDDALIASFGRICCATTNAFVSMVVMRTTMHWSPASNASRRRAARSR